MDDLGEWVRANRVDRSWTQTDLSRRVGTDSGSVSRWERSVGLPNLVQFRRLCVVFDESADAALGLPVGARRVVRKRARRAAAAAQSD